MIKNRTRDYIYMLIVTIASAMSSVVIMKVSAQILDNAISLTQVNLKGSDISIKVEKPVPLSKIESPVNISGFASGSWFFEGTFPIKIIDQNENVLGQGTAEALLNWMTEKMVPFEAKIKFEKGDAEVGFIIFSKDDPQGSGNGEVYKIPITFY